MLSVLLVCVIHSNTWMCMYCVFILFSANRYTSALALSKARTTHGIELKAVVGGGCLTDLVSQVGTTDISKIYQSSNGGYYWDKPEIATHFMERSAMYHVANATAPTLLFHGQHDPRMPISQVGRERRGRNE